MKELNEVVLEKSDLFTIDPFYTISQYNESLNALSNNDIEYNEWISTISPYRFFLELDGKTPLMLNYSGINSQTWIKLVSKVKPLRVTDEVILYRRGDRVVNIKDYINNDAFNTALKSDYTIIFNYSNKEQLLNLSKTYGTIFIIGKYLRGAKRLAMCFDSKIKNVLMPSDVQLEMGKHKLGELETQINYKILRNQDKIIKYVKSPKYKKGKFITTSPVTPLKW